MHSMSRNPGKPRNLHLYIGQNPLSINHDKLVECVRQGITPTHLTMRMIDYPKEDMFKELMDAMRVNKTITFLDLSKISLPYEAGQETCNSLGEMFAKNTTLKELVLSGEQGVLESVRYVSFRPSIACRGLIIIQTWGGINQTTWALGGEQSFGGSKD